MTERDNDKVTVTAESNVDWISGPQEAEFFSVLVDKHPDAVLVVDNRGMVRFVNPAAERLFGRTAESLLGQSFGYPLQVGGAQEIAIIQPDVHSRVAEMRVVPIQLQGERLYLASLRDLTDHVNLREELRNLTLVDELTGLYNRRGLTMLAPHHLELSRRRQIGACLIYIDVDGLKTINDQLGHQEGDSALIECAAVLRKVFRASDIAARIGGDEFVVLALETTADSFSRILTERLNRAVALRNEESRRRWKLSLSMGVVRVQPNADCEFDDLLDKADALMYEQKNKKTNRAQDIWCG